jgi:hypothetical protein
MECGRPAAALTAQRGGVAVVFFVVVSADGVFPP